MQRAKHWFKFEIGLANINPSWCLTIEKICSHQQFKCNLRGDRKFRNLRRAVGVADFVDEVLANLRQNMRSEIKKSVTVLH